MKHSGRYWLFAAHGDSGACMYDELHVYWADRLMGPWRPHEANPVKIDARSARPAGAMWSHDGRLFRPVQDCSRIYGGAVSVQEVTALDPETFSECQAGSIQVAGKRCADAMHTFNSCDGATVVEIDQDAQPLAHDGMRLAALDVDHEADAARVVLVARVVEPLSLRQIHQILSRCPFVQHPPGCAASGHY